MFLQKYLNEFYFNQILNNYDEKYLTNLDEIIFIEIYQIFKKFNFYFIEDIILNYLEIFEMDSNTVLKSILKLKNKLGNNFIYKIGHNMYYLNEILLYNE